MKLKKFTGIALAVALTVSTLSGGVNFNSAEVYAEENEEQTTEDITTNDGFKFTLNLQDQTAEATGYSGTNTEIVIPNTITFDGKEYKVTSIGDEAFSGCTGLSSITIPASVTEIGYKTFYDCTGLSSVTIPDSVTEIGSCAFYYCTGLSSITIPASVTEIGYWAFSGCENLKNINYEGSEDSWKKLSAYAGVPSSTAIHCNPAAPVITPTEKPTDPASPSAIPTPSSTPTAVTSPAPSASPAPSSPAKTAAPTSKPTPKPTASPAPQTTLAPSTQGQASLAPDVYITSASKAVKVTEDNTKATVKGKSGKLKKNAKFQINVECAGQDILSDSEYKVTCKTSKLPKKMKKYIKIKKKGKVVLKKGLKKGTYKIIVTIKDTEGNTFKRVLIVKVK